MLNIDEVVHRIKQASSQQQPGFGATTRGYVAAYDPAGPSIRAYLPTLRDENDTPELTQWMPIAGPWVGSGFGFQWVPETGATADDPTLGEAVLVHLVDQQRGIMVASGFFHHDTMRPPSTNPKLTTPLAPGEGVLMQKTGSYLRFYANGDIEINTQGKALINSMGDVDVVTTEGNVNVTASSGNVSIIAPMINLAGAAMDTLKQLCTTVLYSWVVSHTHGTGPGPNNPPTSTGGALTTVVHAE